MEYAIAIAVSSLTGPKILDAFKKVLGLSAPLS